MKLHLTFNLKRLLTALLILTIVISTTTVFAQKPAEGSDAEWYPITDNVYQFRYKHHYTLFIS